MGALFDDLMQMDAGVLFDAGQKPSLESNRERIAFPDRCLVPIHVANRLKHADESGLASEVAKKAITGLHFLCVRSSVRPEPRDLEIDFRNLTPCFWRE